MPSYLLERDWAEGRLRMFAIANVHAETRDLLDESAPHMAEPDIRKFLGL